MKALLRDLYTPIFAYPWVQEIRLMLGQAIEVLAHHQRHTLDIVVTRQHIDGILQVASQHSLYAVCDSMVQGYLPYTGGVRIGVAGHYAIKDGRLYALRSVQGLVIRVPHQVLGCAATLDLVDKDVLIVSPPAGGKTTFVRDAARQLSRQRQVVVLDERAEIAADGQLDVGRSMVLTGSPKALVATGVVRALAPQVVVCDELSGQADMDMLHALRTAGIHVIATTHAREWQQLPIALRQCFDMGVVLSCSPLVGQVVAVCGG